MESLFLREKYGLARVLCSPNSRRSRFSARRAESVARRDHLASPKTSNTVNAEAKFLALAQAKPLQDAKVRVRHTDTKERTRNIG